MRVDKYLWATRYFKTRNQATIACKKGAVRVNDDVVKPAREVYPGDELKVRKNQVDYVLKVLDTPPSRVGAKLVDMYRQDITPKAAVETLEMLKYSQDYYRKRGTGRPTKKDRRDLEDFTDEQE
ncbi:S4 domain-containing protein [Gilvibacter sp.]|uniref:RNA-binding S4 domain-containing protein n=1 Tax=Gilvibacter sp. TaxID=2729997 RepID=UPI0025B7FFF1|nr:S4 domain-containing protein [Gilvibacter sp.]NQX78599.1 RNA-binding S4 domain-containing protein [Gilvibacter sp.]